MDYERIIITGGDDGYVVDTVIDTKEDDETAAVSANVDEVYVEGVEFRVGLANAVFEPDIGESIEIDFSTASMYDGKAAKITFPSDGGADVTIGLEQV